MKGRVTLTPPNLPYSRPPQKSGLSAIVRGAEERHELPLCEELVTIFNDLAKNSSSVAWQRASRI